MIPSLSTSGLSLYLKINFAITGLFFLAFLYLDGELSTLYFTLPAALSTATMIYLLLFLITRPLYRFPRLALVWMTLLFFITDFALLFDFFIYRLWKFHLNAMVLNILTSPAAFDSIQTGTGPVIAALLFVLLFFATEWGVIRFLGRRESKTPIWNRAFNRFVLPLILLDALYEKVYYGFAEIYANDKILESIKPIPLYQPLTFNRLARKYLGIEKVERKERQVTMQKGRVRYPLRPLSIETPRPRHIFLFLFDAVRADMIDEKVTPNLYRMTKEAIFYKENRSGGNATRFGFFSLAYGLNAPYWFSFVNAGKGALLFDVLKRLDYEIGIYFSTDTRWPEFRQSVFIDIQEKIVDHMPGNPWQKDRELVQRWLCWIDGLDGSRPIFSLVFLDAPHGMVYPRDEAIFQPDGGGEINYATATESEKKELLNMYRNAIHYDDKLFGKMVAKLKEKGLYDDAIVVFTSDHGQEFFEHGFLGHNSAFDKEQTNSPIVLKMPGNRPVRTVERLSSSLDLIPSLMRYIGVANDFGDYSNALADMTRPEEYRRDFATCGQWYKNAIITPRYTFVFSNLPNEIFKTKVYDSQTYRRVPYAKSEKTDRIILEVLEQNRRFIR